MQERIFEREKVSEKTEINFQKQNFLQASTDYAVKHIEVELKLNVERKLFLISDA